MGPRTAKAFEWLSSARVALGCFVVGVAAAYARILIHFGDVAWFINDDWALLVDGLVESIFTPVQQHWTTIPILLYRFYYRVFGANYLVFQATVAALHVGIVLLLRVILRRAGVSPWRANLYAGLLLLFGPGYLAIIPTLGHVLRVELPNLHLLLERPEGATTFRYCP